MRKFATNKYFKSTVIRRYRKVAAFAVLLFAVGFAVFVLQTPPQVEAPEIVQEEVEQPEAMASSLPMRIRIPKIEVDAAFEAPVGVDAQQEIEVPEAYETVAYYKHGPTPGEIGPAVVLGHVDSYEGPAVFYSLGTLVEGDTIEIEREDGTTAVFVVETLERHNQSGFPTKKVYSDLDYAGLRLITCSGSYDRQTQRYSHNLIVFARLLEENEPNSAE